MKKVLIVEDDESLNSIMQKQLAGEFDVDTAFDGNEAEKRLSTNNYDLMLLDLLMPDKNGLEVLKWLKTQKGKEGMKVVVLTNFEQQMSEEEVRNMGVSDYVVKVNLDLAKLSELVKQWTVDESK